MRKSLGRGLDALIPGRALSPPSPPADGEAVGPVPVTSVPIGDVVPNPDQPRHHFDPGALEDLTSSIRRHGIIQPLVVRRVGKGFELIAGERRLRAAQRAGLTEVPVVIRDTAEAERLELALIENIQRADLNPLEEAEAYRRLTDEFQLTQEEVSRQVGKSRSTIANTLRLLGLPQEVKDLLQRGELTAGHARAVLAVEGEKARIAFARDLVKGGVSKAEAEQQASARRPRKAKKAAPLTLDIHLRALADELTRGLGTRVRINRRPKGGTIEIEFYSDAELDRLADQLRARAAARDALL